MYWYTLRKKQKDKREVSEHYRRLITKARSDDKSRDEIESIKSNMRCELDYWDDNIESAMTSELIKQAEQLFIPLPSHNETNKMWSHSRVTERYQLSPLGIKTVRSQIRSERKERLEMWMPWVALLIGVIGGITGLISVWKSL